MKRQALGFDLARPCRCEKPRPAIVGGDGRVLSPLVCLHCRGVVER